MQMDFGLLTLAYCPLLLSPSFLCSIVSIVVPSYSGQLPSCDLFNSLALLSSFGRETSLVDITGPRSIFTPLFTPSIYFLFLLSVPLLSLALILCRQQGRRNLQLLCTRWEQSYLLCVQVHANLVSSPATICAVDTFLYLFQSAGDKAWYLHRGKFT